MNNVKILKILNPKIVRLNNKINSNISSQYLMCLSYILGYSNKVNMQVFIDISRDVLEGNRMYNWLQEMHGSQDDVLDTIQNGIDGFMIGTHYYVSRSLAELIDVDNAYILPDICDDVFNFDCDTYDEIEDIDIEYFYNLNTLDLYKYIDNELVYLLKTFFTIIKENAQTPESTNNNEMYNAAITYYANGNTDCALTNLKLIMPLYSKGNTENSCGCNSQSSCISVSNIGIDTTTQQSTQPTVIDCVSYYDAAMKELLIKMLSDPEFYKDWFTLSLYDNTVSNNLLIDKIILLLDEYKNRMLGNNKINYSDHCGCPSISSSSTMKCDMTSVIDNYIQILSYIKDDNIDNNLNKIYVYGKQFAEYMASL